MKRLLVILLASLVIGGSVGVQNRSFAQSPADPMFFFHGDALWRWTEADGFQAIAALPEAGARYFAPMTSAYLVYQVLTEQAAQDATQGVGGGTLPTNLWLMDTATGDTTLIAGQPDAAAGGAEVARGAPAWSPDGTRLAWTEGVDESALVVYDVAAGTSAVVREGIPSQTLTGTPAYIKDWTQTGILFERVEFDASFLPYNAGFVFYGPDGSLIAELPPIASEENVYYFIQTEDGREHFLFMDADGAWLTMDALTGEVQPAPGGTMTRVAIGRADTSLRLDPPVLLDGTDQAQWDVYSSDGTLLTSLSGDYPLLSPSGRQVLYAYNGPTLSIWRSDEEGGPYTLETPWQSFAPTVWGITTYRLERGGARVIADIHCAGSVLPFRLRGGSSSLVLGDSPNNVRETYHLDSAVLGQIPAGETFDVLDGPQCMEGIAWWYVRYGDLIGWTAEGQGDEYWLAPGPSGPVG